MESSIYYKNEGKGGQDVDYRKNKIRQLPSLASAIEDTGSDTL